MYLARKEKLGKVRYLLRESYPDGRRVAFRDLYDLGEDPSSFIVYPGGNSFHFDQDLVQQLQDRGVADADRELELLFLPFLPTHIQRIVVQMTRLGRKKRRYLSRDAMRRVQERLHVFDRRRFFYLRFGRMDSVNTIMGTHRFLNVLVDMSRDEIEYYFRTMEYQLRVREKKQYVYLSLSLDRHFPGKPARLFPQGLPTENLDRAFTTEICRVNADPDYRDPPPGTSPRTDRLCEYLVRYAVMWFDYEFGQRPPHARVFEEFTSGRARFRPPPRAPEMELDNACQVFRISVKQWRGMSRDQVGRLYRRRARTCHPDQGGDPEEFVKLNLAYERLVRDR